VVTILTIFDPTKVGDMSSTINEDGSFSCVNIMTSYEQQLLLIPHFMIRGALNIDNFCVVAPGSFFMVVIIIPSHNFWCVGSLLHFPRYNGGMAYPAMKGKSPTWVNTSGSAQWITLAGGLRQFASDGEVVELSEAAFNSFKPGGREVGNTLDSAASFPAREMDIWWAIKMGLSSKVT